MPFDPVNPFDPAPLDAAERTGFGAAIGRRRTALKIRIDLGMSPDDIPPVWNLAGTVGFIPQ